MLRCILNFCKAKVNNYTIVEGIVTGHPALLIFFFLLCLTFEPMLISLLIIKLSWKEFFCSKCPHSVSFLETCSYVFYDFYFMIKFHYLHIKTLVVLSKFQLCVCVWLCVESRKLQLLFNNVIRFTTKILKKKRNYGDF